MALLLDGATSYIDCGNIGSGIQTISFWMKAADVTSQQIINCDGTAFIATNASDEIVATSFPDATIYVNGQLGSVVTDGLWHHIVVTDSSGVNCSTFLLGRGPGAYLDGELEAARVYDRALTATEVELIFRAGRGYVPKESLGGMLGGNMVAHYSLRDGPVDSVAGKANDSSANGNHGTYNNFADISPSSTSFSRQTDTNAPQGLALEFDGSDDNVNCGSDADLFPSDKNISVSFWANADTWTNYDMIVSKTTTNWSNGWTVWYESTPNRLHFATRGWGAGVASAYVTPAATGTWAHYVGTWDGTTVKFYIDKVKGTDYSDSGSVSGRDNDLVIGQDPSAAYAFDGKLDDVRVYNEALTADEVAFLYDGSGGDPPDTDPVGHWKFDLGGNNVRDLTGNGHHGTAVGELVFSPPANWLEGR